MKKIVIAGGTGFIGSYLKMRFIEIGYNVLIISRDKNHVPWDYNSLKEALEGAELLINLAGKSISCRHSKLNRELIKSSRIDTTKLLGGVLLNCEMPPRVWINASAVGGYVPSMKQSMTEESNLHQSFLSDVVSEWENTFFSFKLSSTRQIALRTSVVLGKTNGALKPLVLLARLGLGGKQASGTQMFSWIHLEDYFQIILFSLNQEQMNGVVNCTAPNPVSNEEFMRALRKELGVCFGLLAPKFAIVIGAKLIGVEPSLLLDSSFVVPQKLNDLGYSFRFPFIDNALSNLLD